MLGCVSLFRFARFLIVSARDAVELSLKSSRRIPAKLILTDVIVSQRRLYQAPNI